MDTVDGARRLRHAAVPDGGVLVCDGATGTMLHSTGVPLDASLAALNLSAPELVADLHSAYVAAGVHLVQTNTFDANRLRLARVGLADRVHELNVAGARLARQAVAEAERPVLVAGSVGPATGPAARVSATDRAATLREQVAALAGSVDVLMLETFGDIESLVQAAEIALADSDLPVIAQLTFGDDGLTLRGESPAEVARVLGPLDLAAIGANCTIGPAAMQDVVAGLVQGGALPVAVQPNAGVPSRLGGQLRYAHNTGYFAEAAGRFVAGGAVLVGGCCGTTPAHIQELSTVVSGMRAVRPLDHPLDENRAVATAPVTSTSDEPPVCWPYPGAFAVLAGLRAPRAADVGAFVEQAGALCAAGVDFLAITEPAPPVARVGPVAAGVLLSERVGARVVLRMDAAERSLAALQADLLGAYALGLDIVLCRTGTTRPAGDYPDAGSLWDVDSVRLIEALAGLNEGVDWRGVPTPERTRFVIGAHVHTAAADPAAELDRAVAKARAGAHFLVTEVVYDVAETTRTLTELRSRGVDLPVLASIAPFADPRTMTELTQETPGTRAPGIAPDDARTDGARTDDAALLERAVGVAAALRGLVSGVLVHAPDRPDERLADLVARLGTLG